MLTDNPTPDTQYAIFRGIEAGNIFYSPFDPGEDPEERCKMHDGRVAYEILHFSDSVESCQEFIANPRVVNHNLALFMNNMMDVFKPNPFEATPEGCTAACKYLEEIYESIA